MSGVQDDTAPDHIAMSSSSVDGQMGRIAVQGACHPLAAEEETSSDDAMPGTSTLMPPAALPLSIALSTTASSPPPQSASVETASPPAPTRTGSTDPQRLQDASTDARSVRRNMFLAAWNGFTVLAKVRKWIFTLRLMIGLAQLVVGIVVLSLPSSMGLSGLSSDTCNPQGLFVFLTLHIIRVGFSIPIDFYLGLSPHRTPSARRPGSEGQSERERTRKFGSLALDRKLSRCSDLLGLCHIVLFIVGNYVVWTSLECSHSPAKSQPLWIACVCMLSVTYIIIFEVMLMIFLLVFFLPLLFAILRALGLASHIPQRALRPETGKIDQDAIDKESRLVYFTLAKDGDSDVRSSREELERFDLVSTGRQAMMEESQEAQNISLPLSRASSVQSKAPSHHTSVSCARSTHRRRRLGLLLGFTRRRTRQDDEGEKQRKDLKLHGEANEKGKADKGKNKAKPSYPIYPIPAHRATCPICLCDFEELAGKGSNTPEAEAITSSDEGEVEPLRLLKCGHVMHMTCVDQWLTTVSGRCPVCQKPLLPTDEAPGGEIDVPEGQAAA